MGTLFVRAIPGDPPLLEITVKNCPPAQDRVSYANTIQLNIHAQMSEPVITSQPRPASAPTKATPAAVN